MGPGGLEGASCSPPLARQRNSKADGGLSGRENSGETEFHSLPHTGLGVLNQPKACPACGGAEKAGRRRRVADHDQEKGTLNTHC